MRQPDAIGRDDRVKVWRIDMSRMTPDKRRAGLALWLLEGPFHPAWNHWAISLIHLREEEGLPTPNIIVPNASHELMMIALDPEQPVPDVDFFEANGMWTDGLTFLQPIDQQLQWADTTDEQAIGIAERCVQAIIDGYASPDEDWRSWWEVAVRGTLEHYRSGGTHWPPMPEGRA